MKNTFRLEVAGDKALARSMRSLAASYANAFEAALYRMGVAIMSDALPRTPVEFAVLRTSGYVGPPLKSGNSTTVEVGFGTRYAVPQHENYTYRHPRGGGPKYLTNAVNHVSATALAVMKRWLVANPDARYAKSIFNSRPVVAATATLRGPAQKRRFKRAAANVRKRTGR